MERVRPAVVPGEMMGRDAGPGPLDAVERVPRDDRPVGVGLGTAAGGGAEFGGQGREPAGEPGWQQVRAVGEPRRAYPFEQVVGPGEQGLAGGLPVLAVTRSIPVTTADASAAHDGERRGRQDGTAEPGLHPDQCVPRHLGVLGCAGCPSRRQARPATRPRGMTSRASPPRSRCRTAGAIAPVRSAAQASTASVTGSPASMRRSEICSGSDGVGGPAEDGGDVDDGIGQAEVRGGDRAERVGAGEHAAGRGRPPVRRRGGQQPGGDVPVARRREDRRVDAGRREPVPDCRPRVRGAQPVPDEVAEHPGAEILVAAVGEDDQPLVPAPGQQRLADGERRHARLDPHRHLVVRERARLRRPVRLGPHAEHSVLVVLRACLIKQFAQDGGGGTGGHRGHSVTRHSTTTFWSWMAPQEFGQRLEYGRVRRAGGPCPGARRAGCGNRLVRTWYRHRIGSCRPGGLWLPAWR